MEGNPIGAIGDVACELHGIHQLIAALHLSAGSMHNQEDAMRLLESLVAEKAEELDRLTEALREEKGLPALPVARCVPRG